MFLGTEEEGIANSICAQLFLEAEDPDADISLYVNSPGGSAYAGMAIYDMQHVRPDVRTVCVGMGMSAGAMILAGGAPGAVRAPEREGDDPPGLAGFRGTPADIQIQAREVLDLDGWPRSSPTTAAVASTT